MKCALAAICLMVGISATAAEVQIRSTKDGTQQPALLEVPEGAKNASSSPVPLLVHLHSWSADYKNSSLMSEAQQAARQRGWVFLSPNFRGPNNRPEACGSELARTDVIDAVHYAQSVARIDPRRIYILGGSGGGYMALLLAAHYPELWAAVSSWVPISDLAAWHASAKAAGLRYSEMLERCCGGTPASAAAEYRKRSPLFGLGRSKGLPISIHVGIHDGHRGSVPVSHSLRAFNELAKANGHADQVFSDDDIRQITDHEMIPAGLQTQTPTRSQDGKFRTLLHRTAGPAAITIFEGGHETDFISAVQWLEQQGARP
jgi:dipeptidyl aminopeptidase/acylaminoacyl peptidase